MCVEITYLYPHCGCIARIGRYTCFHASSIAKTGFSLCCERYKTTQQLTMTGAKACKEHFVLLKREEKMKAKQKKRASEEMMDGEGESMVMVDGMVDGMVGRMSGAVDAPFEDDDEGKERGQGSGSDYGDGEGGDEEHGERVIGLAA
jgi:hypothetical protein